MIWASETCPQAIITFLTTQVPCKSSEWNVCFKDMTCFTRPQKQSRHSGFVPLLLLTHLRQNNSLWFIFFLPFNENISCWPSVLLSIEEAPAIRGRRFTQLTCNMMQKWTLCFDIVFWSKRLDGAHAKALAWINCNPWENSGDIGGLLQTRSKTTAALFHCRDDGSTN